MIDSNNSSKHFFSSKKLVKSSRVTTLSLSLGFDKFQPAALFKKSLKIIKEDFNFGQINDQM